MQYTKLSKYSTCIKIVQGTEITITGISCSTTGFGLHTHLLPLVFHIDDLEIQLAIRRRLVRGRYEVGCLHNAHMHLSILQ